MYISFNNWFYPVTPTTLSNTIYRQFLAAIAATVVLCTSEQPSPAVTITHRDH